MENEQIVKEDLSMNAVHVEEVLQQDGELFITGLPYRKGQKIEVLLFSESSDADVSPFLRADRLLHSELVGLWKDRQDLPESTEYARQLRRQAQSRKR